MCEQGPVTQMAIIDIGYRPELTKDQARDIFEAGFGGRYKVEGSPVMRRDFVVKKSAWAGVGVRLQQARSTTSFVFTPLVPSSLLHNLIGGVAPHLFLRQAWKELEGEIASFIGSAPEFGATAPPAELRKVA